MDIIGGLARGVKEVFEAESAEVGANGGDEVDEFVMGNFVVEAECEVLKVLRARFLGVPGWGKMC
jgi:hypothetical protein